MIQIKNKEEIIGKTIKAIKAELWDDFVIVFTDDTYCVIRNGGDSNSFITEYDLSVQFESWNIKDYLELGFITKEEYDKLNTYYIEQDNLKLKSQEEKEIEQLKKLKEKYPNI